MKKAKLILCVVIACALCMFWSCKKEEPYGQIQGIVTNASTNEPIQGVNISLSPTGLSAVTGSDGRYEFNDLEAGQYTVQAMKSGFESNTKRITIVGGKIASGDMMLTRMTNGFRLNVEYLDFGTNFSQLQFKIINNNETQPMNWEIVESMNWLTANPSTGNLEGSQETTVTVEIDRSQIDQSTSAFLTVRSGNQTVVLPINVTVPGSTSSPQLQLSETSLDFGISANSLTFYVMNGGPSNTSLNWFCSNVAVDWLVLNPTSGTTSGGGSTEVIASIDRTKINGMVTTSVTVSGAGNTSTITFTASSEGSGSAILQLSDGALDFGDEETSKTFQVKNVGSNGTTLDWTIAALSVDWLTLTPMSGSTNAGGSTQVTAVIDRNKITSHVSTTVTVNGTNNSANLSVSADYKNTGVVVDDGLFCYFDFDDEEVVDWQGNYIGINSGTTTSTDTPSGEGKSRQFNGNSLLFIEDNIVPSGSSYTINLWFKTETNAQYLLGTDVLYLDWPCYSLNLTESSCINYIADSPIYPTTTNNPISNYLDNQWHMLTISVVNNGNLAMIYLDGVLFESTQSYGNNGWSWGSNVTMTFIGSAVNNNHAGKFNGKLDNFRSYNRSLSALEVQSLYQAKL